MRTLTLTTSFHQGEKHISKSDRFVPIRPESIAQVLDGHGFDLINLKTGKAKKVENTDHQTTIARYRSRQDFEIAGQSFDLLFKVPHLTGSIQAVLGLFRGLCANQLNVGKHFESIKVRHSGDAIYMLDTLIPKLVAQRLELIEVVKQMQSRTVTSAELIQLAQRVASARLSGVDNITRVNVVDLIKINRSGDNATDLYTVMNVLQENAIRSQLGYTTSFIAEDGKAHLRNMTTRRVNEQSNKAIELNASIWDIAQDLLMAV